ncbi:MAG: NAD(P)-dependent oxidoreductase [Bordetella sp.]|nr:NAD(P)-dependent oxidoreductase [Bordetella sp.]
MTLKLGFVGLGMMGLPMLENLARAEGIDIVAFDRADAPFERLQRHPAWQRSLRRAATLSELADRELVITMLPNSTITNEVVAGPGGLAGLLARGSTVIDMGSSNPADTGVLAAALAERGIVLIDAPVSGAVAKAATGTLAIMVGAEPADLDRVRPVLAHMGTTVIHTGTVASAHAMKALNNYVYAAGLLAASEALLIADRMKLDLGIFTEVLNASSGRNVATETKLRQFIVPGTFNGGFALALMAKDLGTADSLQDLTGVQAEQLALCTRLWREAREQLPATADNTEIYRYLRDRATDAVAA